MILLSQKQSLEVIFMNRGLFHENNLFFKVPMILLICALFLSYYKLNFTTDFLNSNVKENKMTEGLKQINGLTGIETFVKTNVKISRVEFVNDELIDLENDKIISEKAFLNNRQDYLGSRWLFYYYCLFIILLFLFYINVRYIRAWFVKVFQSKYKLSPVHYIQLKDGKKNALSYYCAI